MDKEKIDRRAFIRQSALAGGGITLSSLMSRAGTADIKPRQSPEFWYHQPLRILQTVLREPDARNYDAAAVVAYMEKTGCNTLIVNGGGIVDFFQNPLPAANLNRFMGTRDILREITTACRNAGIRVVARVDFRGVEDHIYKKFPDWFSVDRDDKPIQLTYTKPPLYASCYNGYHRNEHAEEFLRYIMKTYALDGIWHNSIGINGICYCRHCQEGYRKSTGSSLPALTSPVDELDRYMKWKSEVAERHMAHMKTVVKSFGADKVYTAEVFSMFETGGRINSGIDLYNARDHFDFLVSVAFLTENTEIIHYADLTYAGTIVKFLKSMAPEKEAIILYGGNGTSHRYIMDPPTDLKVWLWEALAAGGRFWNCSFTGSHPAATYDRRNAFHQTETYQFVRTNEALLAHHVPVASIGIYYSSSTRSFYRGRAVDGDHFEASIMGIENVLTENHMLFDFIADDQVTRQRLQKYRLVILPNVKCLSDREIELIKNYVTEGGNVLATFETSLYYPDGTARTNFGLAEILGCRFTGQKINTRKDCYQYIVDRSHPLVSPDSNDTELLINAGFTLLCATQGQAKKICTYVPVVNNQPPEKAWTDEWSKEFPTVSENVAGKGKVLYFSNQPDQVSLEMGHPDMRNLLARGVQYLAGQSQHVTTNAPKSVHAGLTRSTHAPAEYIFSLVNTTSGPQRPLRELVPVHQIEVTLDLDGKSLKSHKVLRSAGAVRIHGSGDSIKIELDRLDDFFSVHLTTVA